MMASLCMDHHARLRWFTREVLPHEADVRRWLGRRVRGLEGCDVDEIIQEAYARIWTLAPEDIQNPRAYLFVVARHIVGQILRRSRVVAIDLVADLETLNIVDEGLDAYRILSGKEELDRLYAILDEMPERCSQAFRLKKFEHLSQREIADRMGIAESTVEKHLSKALRIVSEKMKVASHLDVKDGVDRDDKSWKWG